MQNPGGEVFGFGFFSGLPDDELAHHRGAFELFGEDFPAHQFTVRECQLSRIAVHHRDVDDISDLSNRHVLRVHGFVVAPPHELRRNDAHPRQLANDAPGGRVVVPVQYHAVDRTAPGCLSDEIKAGDFNHPVRTHHFIGHMVTTDLGVFTVNHHILEVAQHGSSVVVREPAADSAQHMDGSVVAHSAQQQVVEHALTIVGRFGESKHDRVDGVPGFDFERSGGFAADHQSFGAILFHPCVEALQDIIAAGSRFRFHRMNSLSSVKDPRDFLPGGGKAVGWGAIQGNDVEYRELQRLQILS